MHFYKEFHRGFQGFPWPRVGFEGLFNVVQQYPGLFVFRFCNLTQFDIYNCCFRHATGIFAIILRIRAANVTNKRTIWVDRSSVFKYTMMVSQQLCHMFFAYPGQVHWKFLHDPVGS